MTYDTEETFWDHIDELSHRLRRIVYCLIIITIMVAAIPSDFNVLLNLQFNDYSPLIMGIMKWIQDRVLPEGVNLIALNWTDTFYIYLVISFGLAVIVSLPLIAKELYEFITPALYENEKKTIIWFVVSFTVLFMFGAIYGFYILVPTTFRVLSNFIFHTNIAPLFSVNDFFNILTVGFFGAGFFYTSPLLLYALVKHGVISLEDLKDNRRTLLLSLLVLSAILTPDPSPFSMLLMSVPFYVIFEVTLFALSRLQKQIISVDPILLKGIAASKELLKESKVSVETE